MYGIYNGKGYLSYNPWIVDYSGTPLPYFKEINKTAVAHKGLVINEYTQYLLRQNWRSLYAYYKQYICLLYTSDAADE